MKPRKKKAKELVLPHSQAKLDLYQTYLGKFLTILSLAQFTTAVNIYDIFCGTGIYKDEKFGSPILAYNSIVRTKRLFNSRNWKLKPLKLIINDGEAEKVDKVRNYLERMTKVCNFEFHNKDSEEIIGILKKQIAKQSSTIRNLILIDPYGYKEIHKGDIDSLMRKKNTEILLFLPVAQMYRFSTVAQKENTTNTGYIRLKEFIEDFFHETHAIRNNQITDIFHYISEIESALTLGKYYSSSYYIQRDKSNYYALFFLTPNLFGLEKILGAKWQLDEYRGEGYKLEGDQLGLFDDVDNKAKYKKKLKVLKKDLTEFLAEKKRSNRGLYEFTLLKSFLPKHTNELLRGWQSKQQLEVRFVSDDTEAPPRAFYINYRNYKSQEPKVYYILKLNN